MQNPEALITLVLYAGLLVGIGLWASSKVKSEDSFLLAGRNLGAIVAGLAYAASSSSALPISSVSSANSMSPRTVVCV